VFVTVVDPDSSPESRPNQSDLWIVNLDGSERTSLTNGHFANFQPVWAANSVYFVSDRSGSDNVWAVNAMRTPMKAVQTAGVTSSDAESSITDSHP
jgi:Tol biopolymer transport system component